MKISIGFSRPTSWEPFAWLIMKAYNTPYDHVYIKVDMPEYGKTMIFQASKTIVNLMSLEVFQASNIVYEEYELAIDDSRRMEFMQEMLGMVGDPYSIMEVLGIACVKICSLVGIKIDSPFEEGTTQWVCSELAAYMAQKYCGVVLPKNYQEMDPKSMRDTLKARAA